MSATSDASEGSSSPARYIALCKRVCLATPRCEGLVVSNDDGRVAPPPPCELRTRIELSRCAHDKRYKTYTLPPPPAPPATPPPPPLPPASPPPPSPPAEPIVDVLNRRFLGGQPHNNLTEVGVLVRQSDAMNFGDVWGPGNLNRLASSIINANRPYIYSTSAIGLVLSPTRMEHAIYCSYPFDGGSMAPEDGSRDAHGCSYDRVVCFPRDGLYEMLALQQWGWVAKRGFTSACLWGEPDFEDRSFCGYNEACVPTTQPTTHTTRTRAARRASARL